MKEMTGWELTDLMDILQKDPSRLADYVKSYALGALNSSRNRFVIIRKFAAREFEGKIDMLNGSDKEGGEYYPISQFGMTLVEVSDAGASSHNVILPNLLKYEKVEFKEETIFIYHSEGIT